MILIWIIIASKMYIQNQVYNFKICTFEELSLPFYNYKKGSDFMNMTYTKVGDYYLPNLKFPEHMNNTEIGKYGRLRLKYLKANKKEIYIILRVNNRLKEHLIYINNEAEKMVKTIINEMCRKEKVDEKLKENNQLEWVRLLKSFKNIAEEIVMKELIYV